MCCGICLTRPTQNYQSSAGFSNVSTVIGLNVLGWLFCGVLFDGFLNVYANPILILRLLYTKKLNNKR